VNDILKTATEVVGPLINHNVRPYLIKNVAAALQAERTHWTDRQEIERANFMAAADDAAANAFEMGEFAERLRVLEIVKTWRDGFKGTEYLRQSINLMIAQIIPPAGQEPAE
jgi:hypothetical protein